MEFAICFKGFVTPDRARKLVRAAEDAGFTHCWFYDSHILWRDCYGPIAMCMEHTEKMRFGPCVTNPKVRDWSVAGSMFAGLSLQSGGRFSVGLGRGDSSMRVMGKKPAKLKEVAEFTHAIKAMAKGEEVSYGDIPEPVQFRWAPGHEIPVWIGAYGPLALKTAGQHGDGVVLQIAEPQLITWFLNQCLAAGKEIDRDMSDFGVMAAAPAYFGSKEDCIEATKWFPAMVGNHVADIVEKYGSDSDEVPSSLTSYIENRRGYDYKKHGQSDNPYLDFITDDIVESFCVLGTPEQHVAKLRELEKSGVTQFNIYLDSGDEENIIATYGKEVIPAFA